MNHTDRYLSANITNRLITKYKKQQEHENWYKKQIRFELRLCNLTKFYEENKNG